MIDKLLPLIVAATQDVCGEQGLEVDSPLNAETRLFGEGGLLDSLGLVSLVISVQQTIESDFGVDIDLTDDKALSQKNSPYRSIGSLAAYAAQVIESRRAGS